MRQTKEEKELIEKLATFNLKPNQLEPIMKSYRANRNPIISVDQAIRFRDINNGTKVRDFMFTYENECYKKRGVYRIKFDGDKFYVGRSKYIETRFKGHWGMLTKFFTTGEYPPEHYFRKVFEYLKEDQWAYYFNVQLLDECYTVDELQVKEQKWLDKYKDDPNCLNVGFVSVKPANEIDETPEQQWERKANTGVARRGGRIIFFQKKKTKVALSDRRSESFNKHDPEKQKKAKSFSFEIEEMSLPPAPPPTLYKLFFGDKYIIHKGKTLSGSLFVLQRGYGYFDAYKHDKESDFQKDYYYAFYDYIKKHPGKKFRLEIIYQSESGYEILVAEQKALDAAIRDKKCKNGNIKSYIPVLNEKTKMHGWITPEDVDRYYSFLESN